jgi:hypothetical protein
MEWLEYITRRLQLRDNNAALMDAYCEISTRLLSGIRAKLVSTMLDVIMMYSMLHFLL